MYPREHAVSSPEKLALVFEPSGRTLSFRELEEQANQVAHLFRNLGLAAGDRVAFALENRPELFAFVWGAQRAGLIYVPISSRLTADELAYILEDSGSKLFLGSDYLGPSTLGALAAPSAKVDLFTCDAPKGAWQSWETRLKDCPVGPIADERRGIDMMYSSGTTGRPKGILPKFNPEIPFDARNKLTTLIASKFGMAKESVYLSPAPLYHAAPLRWCCAANRIGATAVIMEKFVPEHVLDLIAKHSITHAQFVPTHFIRMLKLDDETRAAAETDSLEFVIHAAAPCPVQTKQAMLDWWGPVINEYYAGSEGIGMTYISAEDWLSHPGSVGKSLLGKLHVCDEKGEPIPTGEEGLIYFESNDDFSYHNDKGKTADAKNAYGWTTLGDIGRLDEDDFLYLTDRKSFMIISGGVNIYPQEIENHLIVHPKVADVAVIGAPDPDMGEKVVAVVQPANLDDAGLALAAELETYCREALSGVKTPRQIDFRAQLPRSETGKLFKKQIRAEYWPQ